MKTNVKPGKNKKLIAAISIILAVVLLLAGGLTTYFLVFSNPGKTPADRISKGVVPTAEDLQNAKIYDRVVILGVDGAGGTWSWFNTPHFDEIFENGSVNLNGMPQYPTISAQNWASMFLGVTAQKHNLTNDRAKLFTRTAGKLPSFLTVYAEAHPGATLYSCSSWSQINHGIIEKTVPGLTKVNGKDLVENKDDSYAIDKAVAEAVVERIKTHDDKIIFAHFNSVDHEGHSYGNQSEQYKKGMEKIDEYLGIVYDGFKAQNKVDGTLFICVSDHGHTVEGGHGEESAFEKQTTFAVAGNKGDIIKGSSGYFVTHDLASVVLYALGVKQPDHYEGGVPTNLFNTIKSK